MASDLLLQLKEQTASLHNQLEFLPIMQRLLAVEATLSDYHCYLASLHHFYLLVEPLLYHIVGPVVAQRLGVVPKLSALQQDLQDLEATPVLPPPEWCTKWRQLITSKPDALGGLYVLEGATLGGHVIATRLRKHWAGKPLVAPVRFLDFGRSDATIRWHSFALNLQNCVTENHYAPQDVVIGAQRIFTELHRMLSMR
jgi:heme oxygenase